jgi:hypothetical protein
MKAYPVKFEIQELEEERMLLKANAERAQAAKEALMIPVVEEANEEDLMAQMMGFSAFDSTAGQEVPGNAHTGESRCQKQRKYRQYMNRKGGFNRPLDSM